MKSNLVLNEHDQIAYFYGDPLGFTPEWVSIDVERGELFIADNDETGEGRHIQLENMNTEIYKRILQDDQMLLVEVADNDITKPINALWVPLMITQQMD